MGRSPSASTRPVGDADARSVGSSAVAAESTVARHFGVATSRSVAAESSTGRDVLQSPARCEVHGAVACQWSDAGDARAPSE